MIRLGLDDASKASVVASYCERYGINRVFALSPARFRCDLGDSVEHIEYSEIIQYKYFYRLLQEIEGSTLLVINECLRTQNRQDLTYNCIRHFLNQTTHQVIFQYFPIIESAEDFMVLVDFDTRSQWRRQKLRTDMLDGLDVKGVNATPRFSSVPVETNDKAKKAYLKTKKSLIDDLGVKDPHTIPRNLLLLAGKDKLKAVEKDSFYIGRNNRFALDNMTTYREVEGTTPRTVFEFCHNFIDFSDFLSVTRQREVPALVSDLKVDQWYFDRYCSWAESIKSVCLTLGVGP